MQWLLIRTCSPEKKASEHLNKIAVSSKNIILIGNFFKKSLDEDAMIPSARLP